MFKTSSKKSIGHKEHPRKSGELRWAKGPSLCDGASAGASRLAGSGGAAGAALLGGGCALPPTELGGGGGWGGWGVGWVARSWVWLKIKEPGLRKFWSLVPFAKVPFRYMFFSHSQLVSNA